MQQKTRARPIALIIPFFLMGCSGIETPGPRDPEEKPHAGVALTVSCPDTSLQSLVEEAAGGWSRRSGLKALKTSLHDPDLPVPPSGDLWVLPLSLMPRWAEAGQIAKLPDELTRTGGPLSWQGLLPVYREQLLVWEGKKYAAPLLGDAPVCFYRKDLLGDEGLTALKRPNLQKPLEWDWEDFVALAEYFRDARKTASLPPLPASDRELDRLFYLTASSLARRAFSSTGEASKGATDDDLFSFHFDLKTGKPLIAGTGFVEAFKLLHRMQACRENGERKDQPWEAFRDDKAVLCLGDARLLGVFQAKGSRIRNRVGVCPVPGSRVFYAGRPERKVVPELGQLNRVPYLGANAYVMVVSKQSKHQEAAFALIGELAGRHMSKQIALEPRWGGGAIRAEHLELSWDSWRLDPTATNKLGETLRGTIQSPIRNPLHVLRVPHEQAYRAALIARLLPALRDSKGADEESARQTLKAVEGEWSKLIVGREDEHLRNYRLSLGLTR